VTRPKPADFSHDSTPEAAAGVAPNRAVYCAGDRNARYCGLPGVDAAVA
jgi:hypothetical protein